jgi:FTR1 family protein
LEALLIVGVFLGISKKLKLQKEKEILLAAALGIVLSIALAAGTYAFGGYARNILTETNADILESYLYIFSGLFITYVIFSLHDLLHRSRGKLLVETHRKLQREAFDVSLFMTIVFLIIREGFEIALFTASVSLFSDFAQNVIGLLLGFAAASVIGFSTFLSYVRFPIGKIFKATEYMIILLGASLVQNGITMLLDTHFHIELSKYISFHMQFLPNEDTLVGHILQGFFGIDQGLSGVRLGIMFTYVVLVIVCTRPKHTPTETSG